MKSITRPMPAVPPTQATIARVFLPRGQLAIRLLEHEAKWLAGSRQPSLGTSNGIELPKLRPEVEAVLEGFVPLDRSIATIYYDRDVRATFLVFDARVGPPCKPNPFALRRRSLTLALLHVVGRRD